MDGTKILGRDNLQVDADGDGEPGGMGTADFRTLSLTRIAGTELFGYVYDSHNRLPRELDPIAVPVGDPLFDPAGNGGKTIPFTRAKFEPGTGTSADNPRRFLNEVTSFLDASTVYGSDDTRARALRRLDGSGKLKTSAGDHLPLNDAATFPNGPLRIANEGPLPDVQLPVAGALRAAEVPTFAALHTLQSGSNQRLDADGQSLPGGPLVIRDAFFNPNPLREDGLAIVSDPGVGVVAPGWHAVETRTPGCGNDKPTQSITVEVAPNACVVDCGGRRFVVEQR